MSHAPTRLILLLAAAACLLPITPASAATLPADSTAILSGAPSLFDALPAPAGPSSTARSAVSRDGRYVAFVSESDGLVDDDDDFSQNIYVKDRVTGAVTFVSRETGPAGEPARGRCEDPSISDDGTRVAFTCRGPLDPADTNRVEDVYVRDLGADTTTLASRAGDLGAVGDQSSHRSMLSATGEYVAFESQSTNLHPDATVSTPRVYRRQIGGANPTIVVSRKTGAAGTPILGFEASISDDGNTIAFTNHTTNQVDPADTNLGRPDVYVRDVAAGTTVLASRAAGAGAVGNRDSGSPALAGDGSAVAFESESNNFDFASDSDTRDDVYRRTLTGTTNSQNTVLVSINAAGNKGTDSREPAIDRSGEVVAFISRTGALDPADTNIDADSYVKNLTTSVLQVTSRADGNDGRPANANALDVALSGDGTKVATGLENGRITPDVDPREPSVVLRDIAANPQRTFSVARPAGDEPFVNRGGPSSRSAMSADGRFVVFESEGPALGLPDGFRSGIFVRDRVTGTVTLASRADGPNGAPFRGFVSPPAISADGRRVAFDVEGIGASGGVFVRDIATERTFLASRADGENGAPADDGFSGAPALDADGSRVAFLSRAKNLGNGDTDDRADIHVRDLETNQTILASRGDGAAGPKGDSDSVEPDLNADGTRVSFLSFAKNLGDGDTDDAPDVHVRDLAAGTTTLVSATPDGVKGNGGVDGASIDAAGTRIAFVTDSTNLGATSSGQNIFVRDLGAGTLVLASRADGADGAPVDAYKPAISPDGGHVTFSSGSGGVAPGSPAEPSQVSQAYRRDLSAGRTDLVSRGNGPAGAPVTRQAIAEDISTGGACVSFSSDDTLFGPPSTARQVYVRAFAADCEVPRVPAPAGDGGGPADPSGGPSTAGDTVAPVLSRARLSRSRFRVGRSATATAAGAKRGTVLSFRSSEAGTLSIAFDRVLPGRRTRGARATCLPVKTRPRRRACTAYRRSGTITRKVIAGAGRVPLSGRIGRRKMAAGTYRVTLVASDSAGNRSKPVRLKLRIVR